MFIKKEINIQDRACTLYARGQAGLIFLWATGGHREDEASHLLECIEQLVPEKEFALAVFRVEDWDDELSPWYAKGIYGDDDFAGEADRTLGWIIADLLPVLRQTFGADRPVIPMGYSLAGLFSLWCVHESSLFAGAISCSGSLWFPGWMAYAASHPLLGKGPVYLSLGGKEDKTSNPVVASVRKCHEAELALLKKDPGAREVIFELNPGGHFADSGKRLAKGMKWVLSIIEEKNSR